MPENLPIYELSAATLADLPEMTGLILSECSGCYGFRLSPRKLSQTLLMSVEQAASGSLLCAKQAGRMVGVILLSYRLNLQQGGQMAEMQVLVIGHGQRTTGLAEWLISEAVKLARARSCTQLVLPQQATERPDDPLEVIFDNTRSLPFILHFCGDRGRAYRNRKIEGFESGGLT